MPRGYRLLFAALVGWLVLASAPQPYAKTEPQQTQAQSAAERGLNNIAAAIEKANKTPKPDAGCEASKDNRGSDLCAQWKAADAAADSAYWTFATFSLGIAGTVIGAFTLGAAGFAAWYARRAADETKRGADAAEYDQRPWLKVELIEGSLISLSHERISGSLGIRILNIGRSPARLAGIRHRDNNLTAEITPNRIGAIMPPDADEYFQFHGEEDENSSILPNDKQDFLHDLNRELDECFVRKMPAGNSIISFQLEIAIPYTWKNLKCLTGICAQIILFETDATDRVPIIPAEGITINTTWRVVNTYARHT